jgi:hypothetical protein
MPLQTYVSIQRSAISTAIVDLRQPIVGSGINGSVIPPQENRMAQEIGFAIARELMRVGVGDRIAQSKGLGAPPTSCLSKALKY